MNIWLTMIMAGVMIGAGSAIIGATLNNMPLAYGVALVACGICVFEIFR